jgi:hypothetical protein
MLRFTVLFRSRFYLERLLEPSMATKQWQLPAISCIMLALYLKWLRDEIKWLTIKLAPVKKKFNMLYLSKKVELWNETFSGPKFSTLHFDYYDQVTGTSLIIVGWKSGILFPTGPEICFAFCWIFLNELYCDARIHEHQGIGMYVFRLGMH